MYMIIGISGDCKYISQSGLFLSLNMVVIQIGKDSNSNNNNNNNNTNNNKNNQKELNIPTQYS